MHDQETESHRRALARAWEESPERILATRNVLRRLAASRGYDRRWTA